MKRHLLQTKKLYSRAERIKMFRDIDRRTWELFFAHRRENELGRKDFTGWAAFYKWVRYQFIIAENLRLIEIVMKKNAMVCANLLNERKRLTKIYLNSTIKPKQTVPADIEKTTVKRVVLPKPKKKELAPVTNFIDLDDALDISMDTVNED